jgi:uncharacterized protein
MFFRIFLFVILVFCVANPLGAQDAVRRQDVDHGKISARFSEHEKAALGGDVAAQYTLGNFYFWGKQCFRADYVKAMKWYRMAADQGHLDAMNKVAWIYQNAIAPPQLNLSFKWWSEAAKRGYGKAMYNIGKGFALGWWWPEPDIDTAMDWYIRAGNAGHGSGYNDVGNLYSSGRGVVLDHAKAVEWWRKGAALGDGPAQYNLAVSYETGRGVPQSFVRAAELHRLAAEQEFFWPMYRLGRLYERGMGVPQSDGHAAKWYRSSAMHGYAPAQFAYGRLLEKGRGTIRSKLLAAQQFDQAARQGHREAQQNLDRLKNEAPQIKLPKQYSSTTMNCMF